MTVHSTSFPTDQPVLTASTAEALLPAAAPPMLAAKKLNLRKLLII
jgi:membrane fusion protein, multidrug efflux system